LNDLLNKKDKGQLLYAGRAYAGEEQEKVIKKVGMIKYDVPLSVLRAFKRKSLFQCLRRQGLRNIH
jgi:hypothetical protein